MAPLGDGSISEENIKELQEKGVILVDGSLGEGGGQVLRISIALAAILCKPTMIYKIRHNRSKPGMRAQHLEGIKLVAKLYQAELEGDELYSRKLLITPNGYKCIPGIVADPRTAGSICLLQQIVLPTLIFGNCETVVELRGGTNASMAPQLDYATEVFGPIAKKMGVDFSVCIERRGFFPKGGGVVKLHVQPLLKLNPIVMEERGNVTSTKIRSFVARVDRSDAVKMFTTAQKPILTKLGGSIEEEIVVETKCTGAAKGILCVTSTDTGCVLGGSAIGKGARDSPVKLGKFAATELLRSWETNACVDEYLQDQLIIYMALADGTSRIRSGPLTQHTLTAIDIVTLFLGPIFTVHDEGNDNFIVECNGVGFVNPFMATE